MQDNAAGQAETPSDKPSFEDRLQELRIQLITSQQALKECKQNIIVVIGGNDRPGVNEIIDELHDWLDPRGLEIHTLDEDHGADERPSFWRYWRNMPAYGRIAVFYRNWVQDAFEDRLHGRSNKKEFKRDLEHCQRFEQHLCQDQSILVKFFLDLPNKDHQQRLDDSVKNPHRHYRLHDNDARIYDFYRNGKKIINEALEETDTETAPWQRLNSSKTKQMKLRVAQTLLEAMQKAIHRQMPAQLHPPLQSLPDRLSSIDLSAKLDEDEYKKRLRSAQVALNRLSYKADKAGLSTVLVFEGVDAAGKGGAIRRLTSAISAEHYEIIPVAAPTPDELNHHYLWRFWDPLPAAGNIKIFDRSWYGRVLVERIEGYCSTYDWQRAYDEMNEFEEQLTEHGIVLIKFWLHIDQDEQLERFRQREHLAWKRYKITDEDYRNRERWPDYADAINEMFHHTDTGVAPWHTIAANCKRSARVEVLETLVTYWKRALD